jgi:hypothetical protein
MGGSITGEAPEETKGKAACSEGYSSAFSSPRCKNENTKLLELRFRATLGDGDREVRLEWGTG